MCNGRVPFVDKGKPQSNDRLPYSDDGVPQVDDRLPHANARVSQFDDGVPHADVGVYLKILDFIGRKLYFNLNMSINIGNIFQVV